MSLDPYFRVYKKDTNMIKKLKRIDETFSDPDDQEGSSKKRKSFSDTFAEMLEEDDIDT